MKKLPAGVSFLNTGDAEVFVELFVGFMLAMAAGLICIYMVLLLLFNHPLQPLTILTAVPLCAGGAFGALLLTQNLLSLPALIGLLMLIGIATKNSILLVDYAVMAEDEHGMTQHDALVDACRKRAQPVIMTTLAMGAGMMPIALGLSGDSSFRAPMAIAVIGGLITSTLLSLIVIPAAFTVLDDLGEWVKRRASRKVAVVRVDSEGAASAAQADALASAATGRAQPSATTKPSITAYDDPQRHRSLLAEQAVAEGVDHVEDRIERGSPPAPSPAAACTE